MSLDQNLSRRDVLKIAAKNSAFLAASTLIPGITFGAWTAQDANLEGVSWKKTPCRFCGVGCGLLVGIANQEAVAVKGDPKSPVNKGLCCVKGYHSVQSLYGSDRLKYPMVRKDGKLERVSMDEALSLVAKKMQETIKKHGKDSVAMYGSGQWTIPDGYIASKFMKGVIGTNNLEANARLCMASAVTGFLTSFGLDEPMGCYEDIDYANTFVMWGNNMAEMHPVLFSRILDRKLQDKKVRIIDICTRTTRTSHAADTSVRFRPNTDLAIANGICHILIKEGSINKTFIEKYCTIMQGKTNIGYGLEDGFAFKDKGEKVSFQDLEKFLRDYSPEKVSGISGVSIKDLYYLATLYGDPNRKVVSLWCMGVNQHTRGTWMNNLIYNIHLLTGKISQPGNSPFSLTGQPSACGTVREVGTLTHKLPHGVVANPKHRKLAAKIWNIPEGKIDPKPSYHTVEMFRALDRGEIKFLWIQVTNPMVTMPKLQRYTEAAKKEGRFIVVSDVYPTPSTDIADVILPAAMWIEREGMFGNSERRTQHFSQLLKPQGEALSDGLQIIEVAKKMGYGKWFPWDEKNYIPEVWQEYSKFHAGEKHAMAPYAELKKHSGLMWPYVKGKETKWRYNGKYDPAAKKPFDFYGKPDHRAHIWLRPYEAPPEAPDKEYPFWLCTGRVLEHWHSGSMTRRIPVLHQAVPKAYVEIHPEDAKNLRVRNGEAVRLETRRGSITLTAMIKGRGQPEIGHVFVPFFDESLLINQLTLDAFCPISKQPDYKKCAVRLSRVTAS